MLNIHLVFSFYTMYMTETPRVLLFSAFIGDGNWYMHFPLTQDGATPIIAASQNGHSEVVNILIRNGAMSTCHGRYVHIIMYNNMEYQSLITGMEAY